MRKEPVDAAGMQHLTAEGKRAAQLRQQAELKAQGGSAPAGPRRSDHMIVGGKVVVRNPRRSGPPSSDHESLRLRNAEAAAAAAEAERNRAEQRARQEKFAMELQNREMAQRREMQLMDATDPYALRAANAALARNIASKQSGAAVGHIFSAGYGYE